MITVVRLSNWRAYGEVTLQLETGTTFIVAANGVGKSSLIEAVGWALDRTAKPTSDPIRKGERTAFVELEIDVGGQTLRIRRSLSLGDKPAAKRTPSEALETWVDESSVESDVFFAILAGAWGASAGFVTRTAFLADDLISGAKEPELRKHLCKAFGLDRLEARIQELAPAIAAATKDADNARGIESTSVAQLEIAEEAVVAAAADLLAAEERVAALRQAAADAASAQAAAERAVDETTRLRQWHAQHDELRDVASELTGPIPDGTSIVAVLRAAATVAARQVDQARENQARLAERLRASQEALERLSDADSECPVCLRPLDEESRGHATTLHQYRQQEATADLAVQTPSEGSSDAPRLQELLGRAERLGDPPAKASGGEVADLDGLRAVTQTAKEALEVALSDEGAARQRHGHAVTSRDGIRSRLGAGGEVAHLYERLGVLQAAHDALVTTIDAVLHQQLGPIGAELNRGWDQIFADRPGLQLDADGKITRLVNGEVLAFSSFSSGEKTVAQLLFKLATLVTTTRVPFCWIDEPLEHLDPASRVTVARTLAVLSAAGYLGQIVVTTYEEALAITLGQSAGSSHVRLEYLGTAQIQG